MRSKLLLAVAGTIALAIGVAPSAHAATYGLVMPGDLPPGNPLVKEVTDLAPKTAKFFVTWDVIEPTKGNYDYGKMDQYAATIRNLNAHGIAATVIFFGASAWDVADPAARSSTPPDAQRRVRQGARDVRGPHGQVRGRRCGDPTSFTVWNEADEKVFWAGRPEPDGTSIC